jgi:hypothetical protein
MRAGCVAYLNQQRHAHLHDFQAFEMWSKGKGRSLSHFHFAQHTQITCAKAFRLRSRGHFVLRPGKQVSFRSKNQCFLLLEAKRNAKFSFFQQE